MSACLMVVGCLNREAPYFQGARGTGLAVFGYEPTDGNAALICETGGIDNPTFLAVSDLTGCVYAGSEVFGWPEGTVSAYRYDAQGRRLVYLNKQPSLGSITAHTELAPDGHHLLVANYGIGPEDEGPDCALAVFPVRHDGTLAPAVASVAHRGRGPDEARQERAHPHCVRVSPDGRHVVVADLGLDALVSYRFGPGGALSGEPAPRSALPAGAGPRHFVFHPGGHLAVAICELDSTVVSLRHDPAPGTFEPLATASTLPAGWTGENHCSDLQLACGGRILYAANRGHDSIAIFALDGAGALTLLGHVPCGGRTPRNLAVDPDGRHLVVANQNSDDLAVLAIDPATGALTPRRTIPIGSPMCIKFMRSP